MSQYWDDEYEDYCGDEIQCWDCKDTGKVVAADGFHEYLGYDYIPCRCVAGVRWIGQLGPTPPPSTDGPPATS